MTTITPEDPPIAGDAWLLDAVEEVLYDGESRQHIRGHSCLCGFESAVSRERTKHIARETVAGLLGREILDELRIV